MKEIKSKKELEEIKEKGYKCIRYYQDYFYYGKSLNNEEYKISRFNKEL